MTTVKSASTSKTKGQPAKTTTIKDVWAKPTEDIQIPVRKIDTLESIVLGFRQEFFKLTDNEGNGGTVLSTAGFGGESIILEWKDGDTEKQAVIRGTDLLIAWVATFDEKAAAALRKSLS